MTHETAEELLRICEAVHVSLEVFGCEPGPECRPVSAEINHLRQHFLRYGKGCRYEKETGDIRLCISCSPREEAVRAVQEIHELTRKEGYRYREIAIVSGDPERYRPFLTEVLEREKIPYFMDQKAGVMGNPLVVFLRRAMEAVEKNFAYEPMFGYLKSGLSDLSPDEIDRLENYVRATGRRGLKQWQETWDRSYKDHETIDFEELNRWRRQAAEPLFRLREGLRGEPGLVSQAVEALRALMEKCEVDRKLAEMQEQLEASGDPQRADEFEQVGAAVRELLLQTEQLLGQEKLSLRELGDVLDAGLAEVRLGSIPQRLDQVSIGDLERSRLGDIRALIFLGLNEGIVPKPPGDGGILTDEEREILRGHRLMLAPTARENGYREQFTVYRLLTRPSEHILLSLSRLTTDGQALRPSWYVTQLQRMFPRLTTENTEYKAEEKSCPPVFSLPSALEALARTADQLREQEPEGWWKELYLLLAREEDTKAGLQKIMDACFYRYEGTQIQKAVTRMLYGDVLAGSVTRLEQYAALRLRPVPDLRPEAEGTGGIPVRQHGSRKLFP